MNTRPNSTLADEPLFVVTARRMQSSDPDTILDESLASPVQRQSRESIRGRAERYIEHASMSPRRCIMVGVPSEWASTNQAGRPLDTRREDGSGRQVQKAVGRPRKVPPSPLNVFFATGETGDEYLRHLGTQYCYSRTLEQTAEKIGHQPPRSCSQLSTLPRTLSETQLEQTENRWPSRSYRSLCELAESENITDYETATGDNSRGQNSNECASGTIANLKPAMPPVKKKIMRRQSSQTAGRQQQYESTSQLSQLPSVPSSLSVSLLTLNEFCSAAKFRADAPSPLRAPGYMPVLNATERSSKKPMVAPVALVARHIADQHDGNSPSRSFIQGTGRPDRVLEALTPDVPVKSERRSPAARFFASEYEQMRLAGYEEDGNEDGGTLLLKAVPTTNRPTRIISASPGAFLSPRPLKEGEVAFDPRSDLVILPVHQLKELVSENRRSSWNGMCHKPRAQYRPVITPSPHLMHTHHRRHVDKSAQTNGSMVNNDLRDSEKGPSAPQGGYTQWEYEGQRRYTQPQQQVEDQRLHSAASEQYSGSDRCASQCEYHDLRDRVMRSTSPSWRRLYVVSPPTEVVKNRISRSQEILNEERYEIDIWGLKNRFTEKPEQQPRVERTGRVWQPPPDKPYEFPKPRPPYRRFVEYVEDKENAWQPTVFEPAITYETTKLSSQPFSTNGLRAEGVRVAPENGYSNGYHSASYSQQAAYTLDERISQQQALVQQELVPHRDAIQISPGYSSVALTVSDPPPSASHSVFGTPYPTHTPPLPSGSSGIGVARLENEPTPRHPSTITVVDRPRVNIRDKILSFENEAGGTIVVDPRVPRREFGVYYTRPYVLRSTSVDDDLISSPRSSADRRSVHFANSAVTNRNEEALKSAAHRKIQPPPTLVKKELEDLAELAQRRERLLDRARHRSAVNVHELRKVEADVPPVPARDRYEELIKEAASFQSYAAVNGAVSQHQQSTLASEKAHNELARSQSLLTSEWEYTSRQPKSLSQSNLASWKFSGASFSPRSVVSINGHQDLGDQLRIRTDLSPAPTRQIVHKSNASVQTHVTEPHPQQPQFWPAVLVPLGAAGTPTSTVTKEFKEETKHTREVERYSSLNDLADGHGTLIKIQDESSRRPKSIMKSQRDKQLVVKDSWDTAEHRVANGGTEIVRQIAPKVTETVSTVEEVKRTEEVERRVRESKDKKRSSKKRSGGGGSGHHRESRHHRSSSSSHGWGPRPGDADYPPWTAPFVDDDRLISAEGDPFKLKEAVKIDLLSSPHISRESPNAIWRQQAITANGHGGSQKYGSGQHVSESYHRQTTTKRVTDNIRSDSQLSSRSPSPVLRNGHQHSSRWDDNVGDHVWWMSGSSSHHNGHRSSGHRNRVHKSQSSREVHHNDLPEDYDGYRGGRGPYIEYPPTLPRDQGGHPIRVHRNGDGASDLGLHKSRSYDWDGEHRGKDGALMRKWEADMTGLERDFRDSLLMPMPGPGQNVNQREYREEQIPGGHESFRREVHATSGSRPGTGGGDSRYSEAKQELSFKREHTSDRRPY